MNRIGKMKRDRRFRMGRRASVKRAVVTLKAGDKIELT
jgi:ribosomal protein L23